MVMDASGAVARAASAANVSFDAMGLEIKRAYMKRKSKTEKNAQRRELNPVRAAQPAERGMRYEDVVSAKAEEGLLSILIAILPWIWPARVSI